MDKIFIKEMIVETIIGIFPHERENKQPVIINIEIDCDLSLPGKTDDITDTINYKIINDEVRTHVESSDHLLIEKMAEVIAQICLKKDGVFGVTVGIDKPDALEGNRTVGIQITR